MTEPVDVGIELGRTRSRVAVDGAGGPEVVRTRDGRETTSSAVGIDRSGRMRVGDRAASRIEDDPENTCGDVVERLGSGAAMTFVASGRRMSPPQLAAELLMSLRADVERCAPVAHAVLTVPVAADTARRQATGRAAELAGLDAVTLIEEPIAAAHAYRGAASVEQKFLLVHAHGARGFDATVVGAGSGRFTVLGYAGDDALGAARIVWDMVDRILMPAARREFGWTGFVRGATMVPGWRGNVAKLRSAVDEARTRLSARDRMETVVELRDLEGRRVDFEFELTRADLDRITEPYHRRMLGLHRQALEAAGIAAGDVDAVLPVGDGLFTDWLADPVDGLGIAPDRRGDPATAVVLGAAMIAGRHRSAPPTPVGSRPADEAPTAGPARRVVTLDGEIDDDRANTVAAELLVLAAEGGRDEVELHLRSTGGSVSAAMALYDTIDFLDCDVATCAVGDTSGIAALLLAAGTPGRRRARPGALIRLTSLRTDAGVPVGPDHPLGRELVDLLMSRTGQDARTIAADMAASTVFTAHEAVRYGLVDHVDLGPGA